MTKEINTFPVAECQRLISRISGVVYESPNDCLARLDDIDPLFKDAVRQKFRFDDISTSLKDSLDRLLEYCAPDISYDIVESFSWRRDGATVDSDDIIIPEYTLSISTTAEEIVEQVDEFYSVAFKALTNSLLNKGVTPVSILKDLVDRYSLEAGVDESEEIRKIVNRMVKRMFSDNAEANGHLYHNPIADNPNLEEAMASVDGRWQDNFANLLDCIKTLDRSLAGYINVEYSSRRGLNTGIISILSRWISQSYVKIRVHKEVVKPYKDTDMRAFIHPFPKMSYAASINKEEVRRRLKSFLKIIEDSSSDSILTTSIEVLKEDIENIPNQPAQDISISLKRVIEKNFNVILLEIDNEDDRYATPEFFEASRANVKSVVTTRPAVLGPGDRVISKGLYLVPMRNTENPNNNLTIF